MSLRHEQSSSHLALVCYGVIACLHNHVIVSSVRKDTGGIEPVISVSNVFCFVDQEASKCLVTGDRLQQKH